MKRNYGIHLPDIGFFLWIMEKIMECLYSNNSDGQTFLFQ